MSAALRQPNFAILIAAAWLLLVLQLVIQYWPETALTLNDTDDAMRLVQVREFLAGHGWFDLHMARVQPPAGYDPHWSRLIDVGLAGVFILFHQFVDTAVAERLMRVVWPMLWLIPVIIGVAAIAWRVGGREAATVVLLFALIGVPAYQQFKPGRIDHHNVQIAIVLLAVAATAWSDRWRWGGWATGALTGFGFAIGLEGAHYLALCGVVFAIRYIADAAAASALRAYGLAAAASTAAAFLVNVAPERWTHSACDAIAFNTALPAVIGGLGLALATAWRGSGWTSRCARIAAVAVLALATFVLAEPRCLGGPYAMTDAQAKPIWLAQVREMQPLISVFVKNPLTALGMATFPFAAALAGIVLMVRTELRRDIGFLVALFSLLLAVATMFAAIKAFSYAMWLAMPLMGVFAWHLCAALKLTALIPRFIAGLLLTPMALSAGAITIANAAGLDDTENFSRPERKACFATTSYAVFAKLPPGLVVTRIDYGPFLLALTPHQVMAAPYHRLSLGILETHRAFTLPPAEAHKIVSRAGGRYLATCSPRPPTALTGAALDTSLWGQLRAGHVPDWLDPLPVAAGQAFMIYRIRS